MHITAKPIKLCHDHPRLRLAGGRQCSRQLRALLIVILARQDLGEGLDDLDAFLIHKALDQSLLRLKAEPGLALLLKFECHRSRCREGLQSYSSGRRIII